jgi:hypothetical protein
MNTWDGGIDLPPKIRWRSWDSRVFQWRRRVGPVFPTRGVGMSAVQAFDRVSFEELHKRFHVAACEHPSIDAVVVFRPDLREEETERQAKALLVQLADPLSANYSQQRSNECKGIHAAIGLTQLWDKWIPPLYNNIEQIGGIKYWSRVLKAEEDPELGSVPALAHVWQCTLFGPPAGDLENIGLRLFDLLGEDAARLILPQTNAVGTGLLSRWLIHLADRPEPIIPDSRRQYLSLPTPEDFQKGLVTPMWVPVTPQNRLSNWWAVRLPNVFHLSGVAIEQAIDLAAPAQAITPPVVVANEVAESDGPTSAQHFNEGTGEPGSSSNSAPQIDEESLAIALLFQQPERSIAQIAEHI